MSKIAQGHSLFRAGIRHLLQQLGLADETIEIEEAADHAAVTCRSAGSRRYQPRFCWISK
jgi:hypothetical protein